VNTTIQILQVLLGIAFVLFGTTKLIGVPFHVENFRRWGYPQWFRRVTGLTEITGAGLVLAGTLSGQGQLVMPGAVLLVGIMCGAVLTHLRTRERHVIPLPLVLGVMVMAVLVSNAGLLII
jgi:putative oxidoreductase